MVSGQIIWSDPKSIRFRGRGFHSRVLDYARAAAVNVKANLLRKANAVDKIFETRIGVDFLQICVYEKE
jgi:hypothetical protein